MRVLSSVRSGRIRWLVFLHIQPFLMPLCLLRSSPRVRLPTGTPVTAGQCSVRLSQLQTAEQGSNRHVRIDCCWKNLTDIQARRNTKHLNHQRMDPKPIFPRQNGGSMSSTRRRFAGRQKHTTDVHNYGSLRLPPALGKLLTAGLSGGWQQVLKNCGPRRTYRTVIHLPLLRDSGSI